MARGRNVTIEGDRDLQRKLDKLPARLRKRVIRKALREAAKQVQADARAFAPKDSGLLRRQIRVKTNRDRGSRQSAEVYIAWKGVPEFADGFYPAYVEYGVDGKFEGDEYMQKAFELNKDRAEGQITSEIVSGLKSEVSRG